MSKFYPRLAVCLEPHIQPQPEDRLVRRNEEKLCRCHQRAFRVRMLAVKRQEVSHITPSHLYWLVFIFQGKYVMAYLFKDTLIEDRKWAGFEPSIS